MCAKPWLAAGCGQQPSACLTAQAKKLSGLDSAGRPLSNNKCHQHHTAPLLRVYGTRRGENPAHAGQLPSKHPEPPPLIVPPAACSATPCWTICGWCLKVWRRVGKRERCNACKIMRLVASLPAHRQRWIVPALQLMLSPLTTAHTRHGRGFDQR
jgi:hypothetical protein